MENFVIYNPLVSVTKSVGFKFRPNSLNGPNNTNKFFTNSLTITTHAGCMATFSAVDTIFEPNAFFWQKYFNLRQVYSKYMSGFQTNVTPF